MCGRYTYANPYAVRELMLRELGVVIESEAPRYNIAPFQAVPIILSEESGRLVAQEMRWGLVPFWDKSEKPKIAPINARSEEAFSKPMFRQAIQRRRALFPADGFFEWQKAPDGRGPKTPYYIRLAGERPFVIAGIYEDATTIRPATCALFTTVPNELMAPIHDRMPAILDTEAALRWLKPGPIGPKEFAAFCQAYPAGGMTARQISPLVNNVRNDRPEVIAAPGCASNP